MPQKMSNNKDLAVRAQKEDSSGILAFGILYEVEVEGSW